MPRAADRVGRVQRCDGRASLLPTEVGSGLRSVGILAQAWLCQPGLMLRRWRGSAVVIPTFHRPAGLAEAVAGFQAQSLRPEVILVVDNGGDAKQPDDVEFLRMPSNAGPAGAYAAAVDHLRGRVEWMMCADDDGEVPSHLVRDTYEFVSRTTDLAPAGVGRAGGTYSRRSGTVARTPVEALVAPWIVQVDYIPGQLGNPTYHLPTLDRLGVGFDPSLVFGFEELDLGLQIRRAGGVLLVDGERDLDHRRRSGLVALGPRDRMPGRRRSAWRNYLSHRNRLVVARRYGSGTAVVYLAARSVASAVRADRRATLQGLVDGLRGTPIRQSYIPT